MTSINNSDRNNAPTAPTVIQRGNYNRTLAGRAVGELFVDLFNIANNQNAIREQDLVAGQGTNAFGSEIQWLTPRRAFFGFRVRF